MGLASNILLNVIADTKGAQDAFKNLSGVFIGLTAAIGATAKMMSGVATQFDSATRNINSIAQLSEGAFEKLKKGIREVAKLKDVQDTPIGVANAMYTLVSSGFDAADSLEIAATAARAASAGMSDTQTAVKGLASLMNAYNQKTTKDAVKYSDQLFKVVEKGVLTFADLASNLGSVNATASAAGISFVQVGASFIALTKAGINASESETAITNLIRTVSNPKFAEKLNKLGIEFNETILAAEGLPGVLSRLQKATGGSVAQLSEFVKEARASKAALTLMKDGASEFTSALQSMKTAVDGSGASQTALSQQTLSFGFVLAQLKAYFEDLKIAYGEIINEYMTPFVEAIRKSIDWIANLDDGVKRTIVKFGLFMIAFGTIATAVGALVIAFNPLFRVISVLIAAISGPAGIISATGGLASIFGVGGAMQVALLSLGPAIWSVVYAFKPLQKAVDSIIGGMDALAARAALQKSVKELIELKATSLELATAYKTLTKTQKEALSIKQLHEYGAAFAKLAIFARSPERVKALRETAAQISKEIQDRKKLAKIEGAANLKATQDAKDKAAKDNEAREQAEKQAELAAKLREQAEKEAANVLKNLKEQYSTEALKIEEALIDSELELIDDKIAKTYLKQKTALNRRTREGLKDLGVYFAAGVIDEKEYTEKLGKIEEEYTNSYKLILQQRGQARREEEQKTQTEIKKDAEEATKKENEITAGMFKGKIAQAIIYRDEAIKTDDEILLNDIENALESTAAKERNLKATKDLQTNLINGLGVISSALSDSTNPQLKEFSEYLQNGTKLGSLFGRIITGDLSAAFEGLGIVLKSTFTIFDYFWDLPGKIKKINFGKIIEDQLVAPLDKLAKSLSNSSAVAATLIAEFAEFTPGKALMEGVLAAELEVLEFNKLRIEATIEDEEEKITALHELGKKEIELTIKDEDEKYFKLLILERNFQKKRQDLFKETFDEIKDLEKESFDQRKDNIEDLIKEKQKELDLIRNSIKEIDDELSKRDKNQARKAEIKKQFKSMADDMKNKIDFKKPITLFELEAERATDDLQKSFNEGGIDLNEFNTGLSKIAVKRNLLYSNIASNLVRGTRLHFEMQKKANDAYKDFADLMMQTTSGEMAAEKALLVEKQAGKEQEVTDEETKLAALELLHTKFIDDLKDLYKEPAKAFADEFLAQFNYITEITKGKIKAAQPESTKTTATMKRLSSAKNIDSEIARIKKEDADQERRRLSATDPAKRTSTVKSKKIVKEAEGLEIYKTIFATIKGAGGVMQTVVNALTTPVLGVAKALTSPTPNINKSTTTRAASAQPLLKKQWWEQAAEGVTSWWDGLFGKGGEKRFNTGTASVPETGLYGLEKGEMVLRPDQITNAVQLFSKLGQPVRNINNSKNTGITVVNNFSGAINGSQQDLSNISSIITSNITKTLAKSYNNTY